ncbi:DUF2071 domain-containing protein [Kineosporia rhizophila]|uniref:YqjF family protein n=1 Tax=Kineosporia TaxID=49184 RepID=UPI000ADACE2F|nr:MULTISPECIES: DUF2071 domain-containing protein [Kineosporia]MCE0535664.1 DUF2071 domain-containing protein [Kineosporia rhizophila]GLY17691.1 hypothetical protein Kisp01_47050 [Kineosporia sp. NBRC 101677]
MDIEAVTPLAPRRVGRTVFTQTWADLTFLHWAVDPERVAPYLPPGVRPDVIEGQTYVGLVPFRMRGVGLLGSPGVPYFGDFLETNVRLYSVDDKGRRGVVFVSLDAERLVPVLVARAARLPYLWSSMGYERKGDLVTYTCARRPYAGKLATSATVRRAGVGGAQHTATSKISVRVGGRVEAPSEAENWMTARWGLHQSGYYWPNAHKTWPLHRAVLEQFDDQILSAAGFADLAVRNPDSVLFSPGVHSVFGPRLK